MLITFVLLAHKSPDSTAQLIETMIQPGHRIVVHYDAKAPDADFAYLKSKVGHEPSVRFARRVRVFWGEWSVVQATLNCLDQIEEAGWNPDYVYLMSGMDHPIRPSTQLVDFLARNNGDEFIESVPSELSIWVKSGPQRERYLYRWYFNWRESPHLTEFALALQKRMGLKRPFVRGMSPHLGSQWWVLTWSTVQKIMQYARQPDILRFFRSTLIPDELFFQTLVRQVAADERIIGCPLTFYQFSDYGYPVVYYEDHLEYLLRQRFFMVRKLSSHETTLGKLLVPYWTGEKQVPSFDDEDVGLRDREYDDWRLAHREGPPNRSLVGAASISWTPAPRRVGHSYFVILGTSTAELRFIHRLLASNPKIEMHGQLFRAEAIEFASDAEYFGGYGSRDTALRDSSRLEFLADIVRAGGDRTTGLLLRWGQGGDLPEALLKLANVRFILLAGDPIVSFCEAMAGPAPALNASSRIDQRISPAAAVNRFRTFLKDYINLVSRWDKSFDAAKSTKPKGWMEWFNIPRAGPDWLKRLEACLDVRLAIPPEDFDTELALATAEFDKMRDAAKEVLAEGGLDPVLFDILRREPRNSLVPLSLL